MGRDQRAPPGRLLEHAHLGVRVGVLLAEADARPHVQQVAHRRAAVATAQHLRDVLGHELLGREHPAGDQVARDAADDGLRDRHEQVRGVRRGLAEVALVHQTAVLHDDHAVREGVVEDGVHAGARAVRPHGLHLAHRLRVRGEREHRAVAARDPLRGNDLAQVGERPPVVRGCLPVGQRDPVVRSRRKSLHEHAPTIAGEPRRISLGNRGIMHRKCAGNTGGGSARLVGTPRRPREARAVARPATRTLPGAAVTGSLP